MHEINECDRQNKCCTSSVTLSAKDVFFLSLVVLCLSINVIFIFHLEFLLVHSFLFRLSTLFPLAELKMSITCSMYKLC